MFIECKRFSEWWARAGEDVVWKTAQTLKAIGEAVRAQINPTAKGIFRGGSLTWSGGCLTYWTGLLPPMELLLPTSSIPEELALFSQIHYKILQNIPNDQKQCVLALTV